MNRLLSMAVALLVLVSTAVAQQPRKSPAQTAEGKLATVQYSSPQKRGREIYGKLVPYGAIWRTGADSTTIVTLKQAVKVGSTVLQPGRYSFFTIPGADQWTVVFNKAPRAWGAYSYDQKQDAARIPVKPSQQDAVTEGLTFSFKPVGKGEHLVILWDKTAVEVPLMPA